jgi:hypothetical protein
MRPDKPRQSGFGSLIIVEMPVRGAARPDRIISVAEYIVEGHRFPQKRVVPAISRDYQSDFTTTIAIPLYPAGREFNHPGSLAMQHGMWVAEEPSEQMTPRCGTDRSAPELDALRIDVAEGVRHHPPLGMRQNAPYL